MPDLEARLKPSEAARIKRKFMVSMLNQKGAWLEREMKRILPPDIHAMAHDTSGTDDEFVQRQERVKKYLDFHDIRIEQHGLNARLFRGKEKIGSFFVNLAEK